MALAFAAPQSAAAVLPLGPKAAGQGLWGSSCCVARCAAARASRAALGFAALPALFPRRAVRRCAPEGVGLPTLASEVGTKPWDWWGNCSAEEWPQLLEELMAEAKVLLKDFFGHDAFRPKQEEALRAAISQKDIELYWPTAAGKSLVFQLLAVLAWRRKRGVVIVVEPTIPVMQDQVQQFNTKDTTQEAAKACLLGSAQTDEIVIEAAVAGDYCLVYLCPESITQKYLEAFVPLYQSSRICAVVVDEACYMPLWGHEFRPAFLDLDWLRESYRGVPFMALSGAAPPRRRDFIREHLRLQEPYGSAMSMFRKNLQLESCQGLQELEKLNMILDSLVVDGRNAAVVYVQTKPTARRIRRRLEEELEQRGLDLVVGQMDGETPPDERAELNLAFRHNRINIMVATDAYGQGIDKPDIDFILHWEPPVNIETYVNQIGRAGRDGRQAFCRLCWSGFKSWQSILGDKGYFAQELKDMVDQDRRVEVDSRLALVEIASGHRCRWHAVLSHYACVEELGETGRCGRCDVCTGKLQNRRILVEDSEAKLAVLVLHAADFAKCHGQFFKTAVIDIAHKGSENKFMHPRSKVMLDNMENLRQALPDLSKRAVAQMVERLQESGYFRPHYRGKDQKNQLTWGIELSRAGLEAVQQQHYQIQLLPESECSLEGVRQRRKKMCGHRSKRKEIDAAFKEYHAAVKDDPEAADNALRHLVKVVEAKSSSPDATDRLEQEMRKSFPDLQIRHVIPSSGEHQCIVHIPCEKRRFCGKPSKSQKDSLKDALESACKEMNIQVDLRKKTWILKSMGNQWPHEHVRCNLKLGEEATYQAEIYVEPLQKTFVSKKPCLMWANAVVSAISSVPGHHLWQPSPSSCRPSTTAARSGA